MTFKSYRPQSAQCLTIPIRPKAKTIVKKELTANAMGTAIKNFAFGFTRRAQWKLSIATRQQAS